MLTWRLGALHLHNIEKPVHVLPDVESPAAARMRSNMSFFGVDKPLGLLVGPTIKHMVAKHFDVLEKQRLAHKASHQSNIDMFGHFGQAHEQANQERAFQWILPFKKGQFWPLALHCWLADTAERNKLLFLQWTWHIVAERRQKACAINVPQRRIAPAAHSDLCLPTTLL